MEAKALAQYALLVLKQIEHFTPHERQAILHVAGQIVVVQIAEEQRPPRDE